MMSFIASFLKCIGRLLKNAVIMEHNHNHQTRISGVHGRTLLLCIIINVAFVTAESVTLKEPPTLFGIIAAILKKLDRLVEQPYIIVGNLQ